MQQVSQISASWKTYDHPVAAGARRSLCARRFSCLSRLPFGAADLRTAAFSAGQVGRTPLTGG